MSETQGPPLLVILAGPNGAGKSTLAPMFLRDTLAVDELVNADTIAAGLSAFRPESVAFAAGRLLLERLDTLAGRRVSHAVETTLAGRALLPRIREMRERGYHVHISFLALGSPEVAVGRVAERVRMGGHFVPDDIVRRRFVSGRRNFLGPYRRGADSWRVFDNSTSGPPRPIAAGASERVTEVMDADYWESMKDAVT